MHDPIDADYLTAINSFAPVQVVKTYFYAHGKEIYDDLWDTVRNCGRFEIQRLQNIQFPSTYKKLFILWVTRYGAKLIDYKQYLIQLMRNKRHLRKYFGVEKGDKEFQYIQSVGRNKKCSK